MAQQYLLPCECGKATPVSVAQAGRTISCDCGREHTVPTLAGLRQLERVGDELPGKGAPPATWNAVRGAAFVVGVILALVGLTVGAYGSYRLRLIDVGAVEEYVQSRETLDFEMIDQLSPDQVYDLWQVIKTDGPGRAGSGISLQARLEHDFWLKVAVGGFVPAAIGIVLAAGTLIGVRSQPT